jgi:hypothetical protein
LKDLLILAENIKHELELNFSIEVLKDAFVYIEINRLINELVLGRLPKNTELSKGIYISFGDDPKYKQLYEMANQFKNLLRKNNS